MAAIPLLRALGFNIYRSQDEDIPFFISTEKRDNILLEATGPIVVICFCVYRRGDEHLSPEKARMKLKKNHLAENAFLALQTKDRVAIDYNDEDWELMIAAVKILLTLGYYICNSEDPGYRIIAMKDFDLSMCRKGYCVL